MTEKYKIPNWITADIFQKVLHETVKDFKAIKNFKVCPALAPGENYATVMLKVHVDCLLQSDKVEKYTLMLKVAHDNEIYRTEMTKWHMFTTEAGMYRKIVPEFEQFYREKGIDIHFGAKAYELPVQEEYILLEDLSRRGFRNAKRQNCLDMDQCKGVLKKLAQFHAASAIWVQKYGEFPQLYSRGMIREDGSSLLGPMLNDGLKHVLKATKIIKNSEIFYPVLLEFADHLMEQVFLQTKTNENYFCVLNHGDCWANNIMFQYNEQGHLQETYLVDLQLPGYGTPAQDLLYFIFSSAQYEIKINRFDEMISYYHENLISHLKLLGYRKKLPQLRDLHQIILRYSIWGKYILAANISIKKID